MDQTVFLVKRCQGIPPRAAELSLDQFLQLRSTSLLARLPTDVVEYILLGYLCQNIRGYWTLFGQLHSPQRIEAGQVITTPSAPDRYHRYGLLHSYGDVPAVSGPNETKWCRNGMPHRDGGPAHNVRQRRYWYQNGKLHRDDGPAIETPAREVWYQHGHPHRVGEPAVITRVARKRPPDTPHHLAPLDRVFSHFDCDHR